MDWKALLETVVNWATGTGIKVIIALIVMLIAFKLINSLAKKLEKQNEKKQHLDKTIFRTFVYVGKIALKVLVLVSLISYVGIDTSSITALIASFGVCIGIAVNGALANVAGGVLLLVTRPFRVDDYISVAGQEGTVEDIHIVNTRIRTNDNKVIYIPNGTVSSSTVVNFSEKDLRRVDHTFSISYKDDMTKACKLIETVLGLHEKVLHDPEWTVRVCGHGENAIQIVCRAWVQSADYWDVYFDLLEQVKMIFDANGISIPYKQLDLHITKDVEEELLEELENEE